MAEYLSASIDESALCTVAQLLSNSIQGPVILCLEGDLGAGKTTFARAFIRALTSEVDVPSPTFSLIQEYPFNHGVLYHADLYRVEQERDLEEIGFTEMLNMGVILVEWASRFPALFLQSHSPIAWITFEWQNETRRRIRLQSTESFWCDFAQKQQWELIREG